MDQIVMDALAHAAGASPLAIAGLVLWAEARLIPLLRSQGALTQKIANKVGVTPEPIAPATGSL